MQLEDLTNIKIQELISLFPCEIFDDSFKKSLKNQANRVCLIALAQFEAVNLKIGEKFLQKFQFQAESCSLHALEQVFIQVKYAIECLVEHYKEKSNNCLHFYDIDFASGETHNGKKSVLIVSLDGKKVVFRPYESSYLRLLIDIFDLIKELLAYNRPIFPGIICQGENYIIVEFIQDSFYSTNDRNILHYQIGVVFAFSYLMRITDLYGDNVIFGKKSIYIVDAEACFYRNRYDSKLTLKDIGLIGHSIYSGLTDSAKSEFRPRFDISTGKASFLEPRKRKNKYQVDLSEYIEIVLNGFIDCFDSLLKNREKILSRVLSSETVTRQIVRPTKVYTYWQSMLFSPSLDLNKNAEKILAEMKNYTLGDLVEPDMEIITHYELVDLLLTDIPYFYTNSKSKALYWRNEVVIQDFFKTDFNEFFLQNFQASQALKIDVLVDELRTLISTHEN